MSPSDSLSEVNDSFGFGKTAARVRFNRILVGHFGVGPDLDEAAFTRPIFRGSYKGPSHASMSRAGFDVPSLDKRNRRRVAAVCIRSHGELQKPDRVLVVLRNENYLWRRQLPAGGECGGLSA